MSNHLLRSYLILFRDERQILVFGILACFLSSPGQTFFISVFVGGIADDLGLSAAQMGSLYLAGTLGAAALLPLAGSWIDRADLRAYAACVMGGLAIACSVTAMAAGPLSLLVGFLLLRLTGQGLMTHVAVTSVARYFDRQRGRALSVIAMGFPLAEGIMPLAGVSLIAAIGWRSGYVALGAFVIVVAAPALIWLLRNAPEFTRSPVVASNVRLHPLDGFRILGRTRFFWLVLPLLLFMPFTSTALVFHIQAISASRGWPADLAAFGFTAYAVCHAAGLPFSGALVDRLGARAMLPLMILPALAGIAILGVFRFEAAMPLFLGFIGVSSGLVQTTLSAVWAEEYGTARLGAIRSFAVMLMVAGTALGPATIGLGLDAGISIGILCAALLAAGAAAIFLSVAAIRRRPAG